MKKDFTYYLEMARIHVDTDHLKDESVKSHLLNLISSIKEFYDEYGYENEDGEKETIDEHFGFVVPVTSHSVRGRSVAQCKEILDKIIDKLDEDDSNDMYGSEGWKHRFGYGD